MTSDFEMLSTIVVVAGLIYKFDVDKFIWSCLESQISKFSNVEI